MNQEIKKLSVFVDFVANLPWTTDQQRRNANQIINLLGNFEETHHLWQWNVCLDLFDYDIQGGKGEGNYWRSWSVFFENGTLEISATTFHSDDDRYPSEEQFNFEAQAVPGGEIINTTFNGLGDLDTFIEDARSFEGYITESLNNIEIDIDIWEGK